MNPIQWLKRRRELTLADVNIRLKKILDIKETTVEQDEAIAVLKEFAIPHTYNGHNPQHTLAAAAWTAQHNAAMTRPTDAPSGLK